MSNYFKLAKKKGAEIEVYKHWASDVAVMKHLKGKHWDYCLCWLCEDFQPNDHSKNCLIATGVYEMNVNFNIVTPMWECPIFCPIEEKSTGK